MAGRLAGWLTGWLAGGGGGLAGGLPAGFRVAAGGGWLWFCGFNLIVKYFLNGCAAKRATVVLFTQSSNAFRTSV